MKGVERTSAEAAGGDPAIAGDAHNDDTGTIVEGLASGAVEAAGAASCATASVKGLSFQIIEEGNCIEPGAFAPFALPVNAQQYLLWSWYQSGSCGISLAAKPGNSNHETGLAMDIQEYSAWRGTLESSGFYWLGSSDPWHFDWVGAGAVDHRGLDILAFQRLWNRNNPKDVIGEDGSWGPSTESRMRTSPADGFPIGATCGAPSEPSCQASFSDICGSPHQASIDWMAKEGLTTGGGGGKYCPDLTVTRGQMAAFLYRAMN